MAKPVHTPAIRADDHDALPLGGGAAARGVS
ncbi:hypothetical protein RFUL19S_03647 [Rhizobacter fulvus]|jgi:hypothetical protein